MDNKISPAVRYRRAVNGGVDELYGVPTFVFTSIDELQFDTQQVARYSIQDPKLGLPLDFLLQPKSHKRLLVGLHGLENAAIADLPKFQFLRSFQSRDESGLYLADPTILQGPKMTLGWMAGNRTFHAAHAMAEIIKKATAALEATETVLVGHSAGGYAAVLIGTMVPHSRAVSINGQSVVDRYHTYTVDALRANAFPEFLTNDQMMEAYRKRLDLRAALEDRVPTSSFTFFAHPSDYSSFSELPHFPLLAEHFGFDGSVGGRTAHGDALVPIHWLIDPEKNPKPHALPGTAIPFLNLTLGDTPGMELEYQVDPIWQSEARVQA